MKTRISAKYFKPHVCYMILYVATKNMVSVPWRYSAKYLRQRRPHSGVAGGDLHVEFNVAMQLETRDLACLFLGMESNNGYPGDLLES